MKKEIRNKIINNRSNLTEIEIIEKSNIIFRKLKEIDIYKNASNVMLYISFNNEVLTKPIIEDLFQANKRVFIPVTISETKELIVSELLSIEGDLEIGNFGVLEPKKNCLRPFSPHELDLIIVPGVAFDPRGYRIGYGAGYYDRFLPQVPNNVPKASIAFDLQIIDFVPSETYDMPVEYIITENRTIKCNLDN
ncbi:5-formyltetrahydrofolate cyclo-ligase [Serpentinicella alkaliphila]|uniref:5-formyltetrahydrofolate cyclo-ligase n=1 Tax=Serpentinicella alkaliphila TaxID=1734049 RepID=A0A4R2TRY1_9FIRM|nr:5-formyltetrahydrofolate cyclo-ligase [Serpentinicella alkaliphila]QUH25676.1 5-formyltetrahydrofolate cyclo-ligase [Serpentinicella alkaliphila]TCQ06610.1 5-formyltetrahydrofolate cyclo-ligase [Serpentinicella alkaliphila]